MENVIPTPAQSPEYCKSCAAQVVNDDAFCTNCGYPLKGTEKDQRYFIAERSNVMIDMAEFNNKIRKAGNSLYYLSGLFLLIAIISFFVNEDSPEVLGTVIPLVILAAVFLVLGSYSRKKPLACLVSGLCLYVIVQVLMIVNDPATVARGIIWKIAIIAYMITGIKSAIELEKLKKEHNIA